MVGQKGQVVTELTSVDGRDYWSAWRSNEPNLVGCGSTEAKAVSDLFKGGSPIAEDPADLVEMADEMARIIIGWSESLDSIETLG